MLSRGYTQDITYWAPAGDNRYGDDTFAAPVKLRGRWEDRQEQVYLASGEESVSKAIVFISAEVDEEGYIAIGDHTAQADPTAVAGAQQIRATASIPSMRSNEIERRAIL